MIDGLLMLVANVAGNDTYECSDESRVESRSPWSIQVDAAWLVY